MCDPKHCSKSTVDHKRCESEENPDLLRALKYLKERGYEESEDDEPSPMFSPSPEPQARQRVEQYERGKAEVTEFLFIYLKSSKQITMSHCTCKSCGC